MKASLRQFGVMLCLFCAPAFAWSNNVRLTNLQLDDANTISFDLAWDNSWKLDTASAPRNHDAVWVFLKYAKNGNEWKHSGFSINAADHSTNNPDLIVETVSDGKGVFVKPNQASTGSRTARITLQLASPMWHGDYRFQVFGIEMVYIPEGPFWLGDGVSENAFHAGNNNQPFQVTSENTITIGQGSADLSNQLAAYNPAGDIPAAWPKGFGGFYVMKHEVSQQQYSDFLNTLTAEQQTNRTAAPITDPVGTLALSTGGPVARQSIRIAVPSNGSESAVYGCDASNNALVGEANDGASRACNFLNWSDLAAYLDWAALRPMTEFEFEKAARGPNPPVAGEFAWGTQTVTDANTLVADGTTTEAVTDSIAPGSGLASHGYDGPAGPLRCGFAATATSSRLDAGSSYFGVLELSGNLWELCVAVPNAGLAFTGTPGDGTLSADGYSNTPDWLGEVAGFRGGAFNSGIGNPGEYRDLAVSDRWYAGLDAAVRRNTGGGRGAR